VLSRKIIVGRFVLLRIVVISVIAFLFSCSQVKFVPEDKYLIQKVELEIDNPDLDKEQAKTVIRQKENYKILGFVKFHLLMYNLSSKKKKDDWLKRIGEPPQIYDEVLANRSEDQLKQYANNKGYFRSEVTSTVDVDDNTRKAEVTFVVEAGDRYIIREINYHIKDTAMESLFLESPIKSQVAPGDPFDVFQLEEQQLKITELFRNSGYFYFTKEDIRFKADSSSYSKQILLDLYIDRSNVSQADSANEFKKYYLNDFYISVLPGNTAVTSNRDTLRTFSDTLKWDNFNVYQNEQISYPASLFNRTMLLKQGDLFNNASVKNTFTAFNRLRQFRFVDIQFSEPEALNDTNLLDCHIRLAPLNKQSTSFDIEGTNTSGYFGVAGNITYQHRNIFKGAEVFQIKLKGATERLRYTTGNETEYFNTREVGIESNLAIPKLLGPGQFIKNFEKFLPKTIFTLGFNYQKRPEYTRTISSAKFGYDWKTTEYLRHSWDLLDFNDVHVFEYDSAFVAEIEDLYIKSSFTDHLIMAMNYSLVYNNQKLNTRKNYTYVKFNIESAGNFLWVMSELANRPKYFSADTIGGVSLEYYKVFNTRFAQYIKSDVEVSHSHMFDEYNSLVGRGFIGVGLPYGNFDVLPFEKKYFTGGANGIRAWQVRSLGPGSYRAPENAYPNQSADIKLEANLEYRFVMTTFLEGAIFLDAGNIWAINEKDNRPGAQFKFDKFYKQIALGTGAGLRFDLSYFIFRLDLGLKVHDPAAFPGEKWIIGNRRLTKDDLNLSFAIGYPF
jgi:outer membrane protein assembly factor BamA